MDGAGRLIKLSKSYNKSIMNIKNNHKVNNLVL